jgi:hypothetical protein
MDFNGETDSEDEWGFEGDENTAEEQEAAVEQAFNGERKGMCV